MHFFIPLMQPVKITDPHLVSSFFDGFKRVYLHTTVGLENRSSRLAECSLSLRVTTELEGNICLVEHLQSYELQIPPGTHIQFTLPPVLFKVNGEPVFIRGGNWILSDGLLRLSKKRYMTDIKFHADMNFNMLRCWGGGIAERPEFYECCDMYGLLKERYTERKGKKSLIPSEEDVTVAAAGEEGYYGKGDFTDGPYEIQNPEDFFKDNFYPYGFNPEVGSVGMPIAATIRATMPSEGWLIPIFSKGPDGYIEEIPNPIWEYHKYIPYSKPGKVHDQIELYGHPKSLDDFCDKAQLVNYVQYRALLEGWTSRMWTKYTGVLIWKTQNPWTGLRGQFYDHLHDQTAGFFGCRCAAEPIHVQLNLASYFIEVVNTTSAGLSNVALEVSVWDLDGSCPFYKVTEKILVPPKKVVEVVKMKYPNSKNAQPVYFLLLKLFRLSDSSILSRNFYWLHLPGKDFKLLELHRKKRMPLKITSEVLISGPTYEVNMQLKNLSKSSRSLIGNEMDNRKEGGENCINIGRSIIGSEEKESSSILRRISRGLGFSRSVDTPTMVHINGNDSGVALFLHFSVHAAKKDRRTSQDTRILPVHYTDNYFSLVPGETMNISITFEAPPGIIPRVTLHGWNYQEDQIIV
ncbi:hypothetical protein B296_00048403 [Ensete ventricosum]|uniref:Exo-beta-D-glucosaminidase Ig-fold domain-containing protein n=1 Tax=Ensete ventricosum TaxID=4639 RepID=A0A426XM84_ENSVE|nr:hypothetical protein B296_00048403 [Ensete ventricosum]